MLKYEGYIKKQQLEVEQMRRLETDCCRKIPIMLLLPAFGWKQRKTGKNPSPQRGTGIADIRRFSSGYFGALHLAGTPAKRRNRR